MSKKIFIVEDDDGIMEAMSLILSEEGYSLGKTSDGNRAIAKIKKYKPNLIFLDLLVSGADGRQICTRLKADKDTEKINVVMVSAHPQAQAWAAESGADYFMAKPFGVDELLKVAKKFS